MLCARECPDWCIYIDSHKETLPAVEGGRERAAQRARPLRHRLLAVHVLRDLHRGLPVRRAVLEPRSSSTPNSTSATCCTRRSGSAGWARRAAAAGAGRGAPSRRRRRTRGARPARPARPEPGPAPPGREPRRRGRPGPGEREAEGAGGRRRERSRGGLRRVRAAVGRGRRAGRDEPAASCTPPCGSSSPSGALAGVYLALGAEVVALVQLLVYVGAVVVLVLFALMLTRAPIGVRPDLDAAPGRRLVAAVAGLGVAVLVGGTLSLAVGDSGVTPDLARGEANRSGRRLRRLAGAVRAALGAAARRAGRGARRVPRGAAGGEVADGGGAASGALVRRGRAGQPGGDGRPRGGGAARPAGPGAASASRCTPARSARPTSPATDQPYLLFLQGGPGGRSPRPGRRRPAGWSWALRRYRVLLLDQRGTGRSTPQDRHTLAGARPAGSRRTGSRSSGRTPSWPTPRCCAGTCSATRRGRCSASPSAASAPGPTCPSPPRA